MASPNLDLVRSIYAEWERGDVRSSEWAYLDIEVVFADGPTPGSWTGLAGMADGWRDVLGAWEDFHAEAEEYMEIDGERVLVLHRFGGQGKVSGLELGHMRAEGAHLFHICGGKVSRLVHYFDRHRALAELGLAPD
jgi:ketosteroid isomerase-like protein